MPRSISPRPTIAGASVEVVHSLPVELIASVISLCRRKEVDKPWMGDLISALGERRVDEISAFCRPLRWGMDLIELTADAPDGVTAEAYFEYIASLSDRELTFYLLGRMCPQEDIPEEISESSVVALLQRTNTADSAYHAGAEFGWANDIPETRQTIIGILRSVWESYVRDRMPEIESRWAQKSRELESYIQTAGAPALWQLVADSDELPMEVPSGHPYRVVRFVPSCFTGFGHNYLFGFGKVIVMFSCDKSLQDAEVFAKAAENTVVTLKALADKNRLRLLRLIGKHDCGMNGKQMAEVLKLSPSVVSRHLAQLRNAGLIDEQSPDNRNIVYSLRSDAIDGLSESLRAYLDQAPHG